MLLPGSASAKALPTSASQLDCGSLGRFDPRIEGFPTQVTSAREIPADGRDVCEVAGYISPQIEFLVRLPLEGWNGRYLQTGCGGMCGRLSITSPQRDCPMVRNGDFAMASTDMGHSGMGGRWGAVDPQLGVDFAYRGVHATALVAKALIAEFYGKAPSYSYFSGCSDGGREALMEAQRYPDDFDGLAAGAPAMNFLVQNTIHHG